MEFDANCAPVESQLGRTFYDGFQPLIKLWINEVSQEEMSQNNLINAANQVKANSRIYDKHHLEKQCPKNKQLLKINDSGQNK